VNCPICKSEDCRQIATRYDDRYGYPDEYPLFSCGDCGHIFLKVTFTADEIQTLYSQYYPRSSFSIEDHRPHREESGVTAWLDGSQSAAFRWVPRSVRVLDIGCGFGETLGYYQARGCEVLGVEADQNIRRVAEKFGYKVHVGLFDASLYPADSFDYVTMDQVIEHVQDPRAVLHGVARVLKRGGLAILTTPNVEGWIRRLFGRRWINWHAPYHLQFFTTRSMTLAASEAGLVLESTITTTASAWLHFQWIHLFTCPAIGSRSAFWAQSGVYALHEKLIIKALSLINYLKVNHLLMRLLDGIGKGDNRIYFLRKP
jgi:2-polyprenyl-3-methyl-5-hydroxy-6-metoxy-1,4-benzoquinol methylase